MLRHGKQHWLNQRLASAPVDGAVLAHVVTEHLLAVKQLNKARLFSERLAAHRIIIGQVGELVRVVASLLTSVSLDLLEDALLALDLEHHLHVDVLYVVVFLGDHERSAITVQVIQRVVAMWSLTRRLSIV